MSTNITQNFDATGKVNLKARGSVKGNINVGTVVKIPGLDGATFTPAVDEFGNLTWTNDGNLPNPDPINIRGPQGIDGENGKDGADGRPGENYILTEADKTEIAEIASTLVDVPSDEHINNLINTALGVIENGTY